MAANAGGRAYSSKGRMLRMAKAMGIILGLGIIPFGAIACRFLTPPRPPTPSPVTGASPSPTEIRQSTPTMVASQRPVSEPVFDGAFLLRVQDDHPAEIWTTSYPYDEVEPLFKEDGYSYGMPVWSNDGSRLAFSKTQIGCPIPSSSIWISEADGSEARQASDPITGHLNPETGTCEGVALFPASPWAWVQGHTYVAISLGGPKLLSLDSNEAVDAYPREVLASAGLDSDYVRAHTGWHRFSPGGERGLLIAGGVDGPTFLWMDPRAPEDARILRFPSDFDLRLIGLRNNASWSPDADYLLVTEQQETYSRLWRIDVERDDWRVVATKPARTDMDQRQSTIWSIDGRWAAWWTFVYSSRDEKALYIDFLETQGWGNTRVAVVQAARGGTIAGWLRSTDGRPYLVVWSDVPGGGVLLLDPEDPAGDQVLIPYETLAAQIPRIKGLEPGPWQP